MFVKSSVLLLSTYLAMPIFLTVPATQQAQANEYDVPMQMNEDNQGYQENQDMDNQNPGNMDDQNDRPTQDNDNESVSSFNNNNMDTTPDNSMNYDQNLGYNDQNKSDNNITTGTAVNVKIENNTGENFSNKASNIQYQVYLQLFENENDSHGSDAFRQDVDINSSEDTFTATFDNYNNQPGQLFVALSQSGSETQMYCKGSEIKDGRIDFIPQITVVLHPPKGNYMTKNGNLKNNTYPECEVIF